MKLQISTYFYHAILNLLYGQTPYTIPTIYYFSLLENDHDFEDGDTPVEHSGDGYARVAVNNNKTNFTVADDRKLELDIQVDFPESTADWGNQYWIAIWDGADSTDNILAWGKTDVLTGNPVNVPSGKIASIKRGSLTVIEPTS